MEIHIGNRIANVELVNKDGNKVSLTIDGKPYDVDIVMVEKGACSILNEGKSYNAELLRYDKGKKYKINTHYSSFDVEIVDTQAKYLRMRQKTEEKQDDSISSPMPGKVVKIPVTVGQVMKPNETVIVIEAMKMQSNYKVKGDCRIKSILVAEGDSVAANQPLITVDTEGLED
jgi:biotin carboxyl carrier protein